ncbi:hypothetical protein [Stenotrophomonas sp. NPDC078853]|uniref:hypothetical protein n=1 Tax=Stenotrophomonas sp. NPDC078853 TaxID=3364534 RepID=UPI00384CC359
MPQQLPPGFEIRPFLDGPALYLDGRMIGVASPTSSGKTRLDLCVGTLKSHSNFIASIGRAEDYLRGWAVKWEGRIRELYG